MTAADALIAVTPIFTASYSGLFKTFFDVLDKDALAGKPMLIAATAGTPRHSLALEHALRPLFAYLRAVVVPTAVFAATEDFGSTGAGRLADARRAGRRRARGRGAAPAPAAAPPTRSRTSRRSRSCSGPDRIGTMRLVDLSHTISDGLITYPGLPGPVISEHLTFDASHATYDEGTEFSIGRIEMVSNTGTYLDTPGHRHRGAP